MSSREKHHLDCGVVGPVLHLTPLCLVLFDIHLSSPFSVLFFLKGTFEKLFDITRGFKEE